MQNQSFALPIEYNPNEAYSRSQLINLLRPHGPVLCFFAMQAGEKRCVLGVDFDKYDHQHGMVPVHIIPTWAVKRVLIPAEGSKFRNTYRRIRVGRDIMVTFTGSQAAGWFKLDWELDKDSIITG